MSLDMSPYKDKTTKIIGPPGTGKTHTLMEEVGKIIDAEHPICEIGFFAFTTSASDIALKRIREQYPEANDFSGFRTLHGQALRCLPERPEMLTREQALEYDKGFSEKEVYKEIGSSSKVDYRLEHPILDMFEAAKAKRIDFRDYLKSLNYEDDQIKKLLKFEEGYTQHKKDLDVIDYTDMLERALEVDDDDIPAYTFIFIDEAQDLSRLQWEFVTRLLAKTEKIFLAGDEDQAICESFGAEPQIFVNFPCKEERLLEVSRRIPKAIRNDIFKDGGIVAELKKRFPRHENKDWYSEKDKENGITGKLNWQACLSLICDFPKKDWLIMAATNKAIGEASNHLIKRGVPHTLSNKRIPVDTNNPNIQLKTIWKAKGGEADCTVLLRDNTKNEEMYRNDPRLLYVAKTRAKEVHIDASDEELKPPLNFLSEPRRSKEEYESAISELEDKQPKNNDTPPTHESENQPKSANHGEKNSKYPTLLDVRYSERLIHDGKKKVKCIEIDLDDGTCRAKTFGNLKRAFAEAKQLIDKRVGLDVWGSNNPKKWFNNIWEAED